MYLPQQDNRDNLRFVQFCFMFKLPVEFCFLVSFRSSSWSKRMAESGVVRELKLHWEDLKEKGGLGFQFDFFDDLMR